ncbi:Uma2 family endonuclease [Sphingomonas adhaesiva]|uniref:Uma2 family endonuclease n=1 Tax=Sphingomonas adhaesiva TaxID=28212 RepID=UPI002FF5FFA5
MVPLEPADRRLTVEQFLDMDLDDTRAELEDGLICTMAGATEQHSRVAGNLLAALRVALRGKGYRPYGCNLAVRTGKRTIRFPDVSLYRNDPADRTKDKDRLLGDPTVVFEVLSPSTAAKDQKVKLEEYKALPGTSEVILIDPDGERIRRVHRTADGVWHAEIFARD